MELWPEFNHKAALMRAYHAADKNKDGFVTRKEFGNDTYMQTTDHTDHKSGCCIDDPDNK